MEPESSSRRLLRTAVFFLAFSAVLQAGRSSLSLGGAGKYCSVYLLAAASRVVLVGISLGDTLLAPVQHPQRSQHALLEHLLPGMRTSTHVQPGLCSYDREVACSRTKFPGPHHRPFAAGGMLIGGLLEAGSRLLRVPLGASLRRLLSFLGASLRFLGASWGPPRDNWAAPEASCRLQGRKARTFGSRSPFWDHPGSRGLIGAFLGHIGRVLRRHWAISLKFVSVFKVLALSGFRRFKTAKTSPTSLPGHEEARSVLSPFLLQTMDAQPGAQPDVHAEAQPEAWNCNLP